MSTLVRDRLREFRGDFQHVLAEQRHPGGSVSLFQVAASRQRRTSVEHADVVQPQEFLFSLSEKLANPFTADASKKSVEE